jgi:hypothetical protein
MSAILDLSFNSPYNDRNQKLSFLIDISLVGMTPGDIMGLMLVLNDEDISPDTVNNIRYYNLDLTTITFNNLSGQVTFVVPFDADFIRNGDEYTARAMLEHNNGSLFKSNTVVDIVPFTTPDKPSFSRVDPTLLNPLVDAGFDLKLLGIEDETYWNGGSQLTSVKWIWSKVTGAGTGMIEFKTFVYDPNSNMYRIDVSNSMFSDGIIDTSDNYEVSVVVRNLAGESEVSQGLVLNALNIPDRPLSLIVAVNPILSSPNTAVIQTIFGYPFDYANSSYKELTYRVFWDTSNIVGIDSSYTDFDVSTNIFDHSAGRIYVNLNLAGSLVYNKTVYLKVQALNINGGSPLSNIASIAPYSVSAAPTNLRIKLGPLDASENTAVDAANDANDGSSNAIVYFTAPSPLLLSSNTDASFVRYEVLDNSGNVLGFNTNQSDNFVSVTGLTNFSQYNISVRVQTSYQNVTYNGVSSSSSNIIPFTYPLDVSLTSAVEGDTEVLVEWTSSDSHPGFPVYYRVGYKKTSDLSYTYAEISDDNTLSDSSFNFTDLINSQEYIFEITPFYIVEQQYYTVAGNWVNNGTLKYYGNSITVTKIPIKNPTLGNINFIANLGPMKSDFSAANYANQIQNNYDGNNKVVLSWTPPLQTDLSLSAYVYFVKYEIADSNETIVFESYDRTQSIYVLTSANIGNITIQNYVIGRYKIRATVSNGNIDRTSDWSALTVSAAPFVYPIDISINSAIEDDSEVEVAWTSSDSHAGVGINVHYRIGYKLSIDSSYTYDNTDNVSHNFTGLTNSSSYDFEITPFYNVNDENYYGNSVTVTRTPVERPSLGDIEFTAHFGPMKLDLSVANYAEDASYNGNNQVVLTWVPPVDANLGLSIDVSFVSYEIADSNENILVTLTDRNIDLYVLTSANGVVNGTARQYKIRANVTNGLTTFTSLYSDLTANIAPFTFPAAPTNVSAAGSDNYIVISWSDVNTQFSYTPVYYVQGDENAASDITGLAAVRTYIVYGRHSGDVATFIEAPTVDPLVTARYYSAPVAWTSVSYKTPDAINNFQVLAGPLSSLSNAASILANVVSSYDGSNSVVLTWDRPTDSELGLGNGDGIQFLKYVITTPDNNTHDITDRNTLYYFASPADGVVDGQSKNYSIVVYTDVSYVFGGAVASLSVTESNTSFTFPPILSGLGVVSDDTVANVSWNTFYHPIAGIDKKFLVEWKLVSASSWDASAVVVNDVSYQITGLLNNSSYNVRVTPFITVTQTNDLGTNNYFGDAANDFAYPIGTPVAITNFNVLTGPLDASLNPTTMTSGFNGNTGTNMVTFVWNNPADISSWGNGSSVNFVRFEVQLQNTSGGTDICMNFLNSNNGANAQEVVAKFSRMLAGAANNNASTGLNTINGVLRSYRVRVVTSNNDVTPVFKYSAWSTLISARAFDRPNAVNPATFTATSQDQSILLNWVDLPLQDNINPKYAIYLNNILNQTTPEDATSATVGSLTNGVRYNGAIRTVITAIWDNANQLTSDYFANAVAFSGVPTTTPDAPAIIFGSEIELDRNINFTLDSTVNNNYPLWTLNDYTLNVTDVSYSLSNTYTLLSTTTFFDVSNNAWGTLANGHMYNFNIVGNYTYNDGSNAAFNRTTAATVFTLSPYDKPIIDISATIIGYNSGDIQIHVDPNGRPLENIWLVGIPESLDTTIDNSWNFVYSSEMDNIVNLPDARYGQQIIQIDDPFNTSQTTEFLKICYMFVSNLRGTSTYDEVGSNFNLP